MSTQHVAIYARVSSEQQAAAQTIASQVAALHERVVAEGFALPDALQFIDEGYSRATLVRPALERLRDLVALGGVDRLSVQAPDRLARKYAYPVLLLEEFGQAGVAVVFLNRAWGGTPEDDLLRQVQGMVAEYERAKILERSRRGKRHAQRGVVTVLAGAPYGYRYVPKALGGGEARYEIVLEEARVVRQIFSWVGQERQSIGEVCRRLTQAAIPTRTGKLVWDRSVVWAMLTNPAYRGAAAFGKTRAVPYAPQQLRAQRGRPAQPRRAVTTTAVPSEEWLMVPVPPLIDAALFAAVQEQLAENRRHARQRQRGARYLLQGLVCCAQCGYAYYGKAVTRQAAKGPPRAYAYYRCLGTDAYRFGGERVCTNRQVRTDRLDAAVWQEVRTLLEHPDRLAEEYRRRLVTPPANRAEQTMTEAQLARLRQGLARLIDSYAEGLVEHDEFAPRITRLRQRIRALETRTQQLADEAALQADLRLIVGRLDEFAAQVRDRLETADWETCRELVRALVKRVEIGPEGVNVVFRVPPVPFVPSPEASSLPDRRRGADAALRGARLVGLEVHAIPDAGGEPSADDPSQRGVGAKLRQQRRVVDAVETGRDVGVEDELVLELDRSVDRTDGIMGRASRAKPVAVGLEASLPFGFEGEPHQRLRRPVPQRRYPERPSLRFAWFGYPDAADRSGLWEPPQVRGKFEPSWRRERFHPVHASRVLATVVLGDPPHGEAPRRPGVHQEPLQAVDRLRIATTGGSEDALLQLEDRPLQLAPGEVFPFIHWRVRRRRPRRAHDVCTPTCAPSLQLPWSTSAYPWHCPGRWLLGPSLQPPGMRRGSLLRDRPHGEPGGGYFVPGARLAQR